VQTLSAAQRQQIADMANVGRGVQYLSDHYKTTYVGAINLATMAGVHVAEGITGQSRQAQILRFQIASLVAGYVAMGQPIGVVGRDMNALAVSEMLQQSKVQQLNSAWDTFMSTLTGGTSDLAQFEQGLTNLSTGTNRISNILGRAGSLTLSVQNFATSLKSFTGKGAQAWQNFDQIVSGSAQGLIDWFRTAGTEGMLSSSQFTQGVRDMVAQLLPFASKSQAATSILEGLAQQAGGPAVGSFSSLKHWVDEGHTSMSGLASIIDKTTTKMGDMSQVAQNLGSTVQTDIINTMSAAKLQVDNVGKATLSYTQILNSNHSTADQIHTAYQHLVQVLTDVTGNNKLANTIAQTYARSMGDDSEQAYKFNTAASKLSSTLGNMHSKTVDVFVDGRGNWTLGGTTGGDLKVPTHFAGGGIARGGTPGKDSVLSLLMPGEGVLTTNAVKMIGAGTVHALNNLASRGIKRFAAGGIVPHYSGSVNGEGSWAQNNYNATVRSFASSLASSLKSAMAAAAEGGGSVSGSVVSWIKQAMALVGAPANWLPALEMLVSKESGGRANAVDPITVMGQHAEGLWQMLPSTFAVYSRGGSIWNPIAEGVAALHYIMTRYGSPFNIPGLLSGHYQGYANGTTSAQPGPAWVAENGPELINFRGGESVTPLNITCDCADRPIIVMLDGKKVGQAVQANARQYNRRVGPKGTDKWSKPG
jgi:SLT domain-containing protein